MSILQDVNQSLAAANRSYYQFSLALQVFQAETGRYGFEAAEGEREKLHAHLDDYLDHFMAANRRVQYGDAR